MTDFTKESLKVIKEKLLIIKNFYKRRKEVNINSNKYKIFLNSILQNTDHTLSSLSEILDIPKRKLAHANRLSQCDFLKIDELRKMLEKVNCSWLIKL